MRILEFNVEQQRLRKAKDCDFSHIAAGTVGYLKAHFTFSPEWSGCKKAASFWVGDQENAVLLDESNGCIIPSEVLTGEKFSVSVMGVRDNYQITSTKIKIKQEVN